MTNPCSINHLKKNSDAFGLYVVKSKKLNQELNADNSDTLRNDLGTAFQ